MKPNSCCANCGVVGDRILGGCPICGYIGHRLPLIDLSFPNKSLFVEMEKYESNDTKAVKIYSNKGKRGLELFAEITTNFEFAEKYLADGEIMVKTWSGNESLIGPLLKSGYFEDLGKTIEVSQWCKASIWKIIKPIPQNIQPDSSLYPQA